MGGGGGNPTLFLFVSFRVFVGREKTKPRSVLNDFSVMDMGVPTTE